LLVRVNKESHARNANAAAAQHQACYDVHVQPFPSAHDAEHSQRASHQQSLHTVTQDFFPISVLELSSSKSMKKS